MTGLMNCVPTRQGEFPTGQFTAQRKDGIVYGS